MLGNLRGLEAYYWAARLGGFGAAATHLGLTQPSISVRIKELEREVGTKLFYRAGRNVRLSDAGVAMFDYVERVLTVMHDLEGHVRRGGPLRGLIRLGVPDSFALLCLADFLKELDRQHPELNVAVTVDNSRALGQKLEEGTLDVAILAQPQNLKLFQTEFLGYQPVTWVANSASEFSSKEVHPEVLVAHQIVTNPSPSPTFSLVMDWFADNKFVPTRLSTCNSVAIIIELVSAGAAISILPVCIIEDDLRNGTLVALKSNPSLPNVEMFAAFPRKSISRAVPEIVELARRLVSDTGFVEAPLVGKASFKTARPDHPSAS
jgi:LysR family cyn operon transcriptional activator